MLFTERSFPFLLIIIVETKTNRQGYADTRAPHLEDGHFVYIELLRCVENHHVIREGQRRHARFSFVVFTQTRVTNVVRLSNASKLSTMNSSATRNFANRFKSSATSANEKYLQNPDEPSDVNTTGLRGTYSYLGLKALFIVCDACEQLNTSWS